MSFGDAGAAGANGGAAFGTMSVDLSAVGERVLQQVIAQLARDGMFTGATGVAPEDLLAAALGNWVTRMLVAQEPEVIDVVSSSAGDEPLMHAGQHDELLERLSDLAAALGACDCWGEMRDCPYCDGDGSPGWIRPDKRLFALYVYPALRALPPPGGTRGTARSRQTAPPGTSYRKGNGHG